MRTTPVLVAATLCLFPVALSAQQASTPTQDPSHHNGVTARGDHAMGFSHETTTHHFRLSKSGGVIDVSATDPKDSATRDQIRVHLAHVVKRFSVGDFDVPMFIHDTTPPGVPVMAKLRSQIRYLYNDTTGGAKIRITSANAEALDAIHAFLRFQISDHQTGDPSDISGQ